MKSCWTCFQTFFSNWGLAALGGHHTQLAFSKSRALLGVVNGIERSRVNELVNPDPDRPLTPAWRVLWPCKSSNVLISFAQQSTNQFFQQSILSTPQNQSGATNLFFQHPKTNQVQPIYSFNTPKPIRFNNAVWRLRNPYCFLFWRTWRRCQSNRCWSSMPCRTGLGWKKHDKHSKCFPKGCFSKGWFRNKIHSSSGFHVKTLSGFPNGALHVGSFKNNFFWILRLPRMMWPSLGCTMLTSTRTWWPARRACRGRSWVNGGMCLLKLAHPHGHNHLSKKNLLPWKSWLCRMTSSRILIPQRCFWWCFFLGLTNSSYKHVKNNLFA